MNTKTPGRLAHWALRLQEYVPFMSIVHRPGKHHVNADVPSRQPIKKLSHMPTTEEVLDLPSVLWIDTEIDHWVARQKQDPKLLKIRELCGVRQVSDRSFSDKEKKILQFWRLERDVLKRKVVSKIRGRKRVVKWLIAVPPLFQRDLVVAFHDKLAHVGRNKTMSSIKGRFYWRGCRKMVAAHLRTCHHCQLAKAHLPFRHGTLRPKEVVGPNHTVSIDINGPHPKSMGYEYILTMVDCFTRWLVLVPLRSINAAAVADACFHHWIKHHSCPTRILTDQGAQFEGQMFRRLCDRLGITKVRTSAYHPQTNAQAERVHRFLKSSLKALVGKNPKLWP